MRRIGEIYNERYNERIGEQRSGNKWEIINRMKDVKREAKGDDGNRANMSEIGKIEVADVIVQEGGENERKNIKAERWNRSKEENK